MTVRHRCAVLDEVLTIPPKEPGLIPDTVRRAFVDSMAGHGSFYEWWASRDPALANAVRFCPLCGTELLNG
jgi:hypothetical protein